MSFGSGGGFAGFGSTNNQNSSTGFGFGTNNNNNNNTTSNTGFGSNTTNSGFGGSSTAANPFSSSAFGSNTGGGFGAANTTPSLFASKPTSSFGASTPSSGNSLFGGTTATANSGFGSGTAFGSNTSGGFGNSNNNTGSSFSFGAQKTPAFGSNTGSTLFGAGGAGTTGGFSSTSPFGGSGTALSNQPVPPSDGTNVAPFAPINEKEPNGSNISYQSISFMQPYQKYAFEEMRLADYNAGRRFGNGSGQAGGFGSNSFGGFSSNNTTGFGNTTFGASTSSSAPFGSTQTTGFGSGGLFGNNKPANAGLFGNTPSTSATSGGLFGAPTTNTGGFGAGTSTAPFGSSGTGGLFSSGQNQSQNPANNLFGSSKPAATGFGGFGSNNTSNTNPFGASTGGNLFGGSNTQAQPPGLFGSSQTQNQPKPSLFGATSTQSQPTGGLFGSSNPTNNGGLFGSSTGTSTQNQGGGIFGGPSSNQSNSLFGSNNNTQRQLGGTSGGLFGNPQPQTGGMFGSNIGQQPQQQQQQPGIFPSTNSGGIFGSSAKPSGSLFGGTNTNLNQGSNLFSSNTNVPLFGTSQTNQTPPQLNASLHEGNPFSHSSIWTGVPSATPQNSGPLVTPLTANQRLKESQTKPAPQVRFMASRYMTPPRRQGYGFTYSTYGTPNSAASTPGGAGLSGSMYGKGFTGGSFGRSMGKSFSATNLRQQFAADGESVLSPGAFAPGSSRYSGGSIRRLTIDRNIKTDLFNRPALPALPAPNSTTSPQATTSETTTEQPNKLKKRVSFDKDTTGGDVNGEMKGASSGNGTLIRTETDEPESAPEEQGSLRPLRWNKGVNGSSSKAPEMEQVRGNELAVVPEDRESDNIVSKMRLPTDANAIPDPNPGEYWMKPSRAEMSKMPREKLQRFKGYKVGRYGCGDVTFDEPVDLTTVNLDDVYDKFVEIRLRSITVYPDASTKPMVGKGLNVPSTLRLENSWPRARNLPSSSTSGPIFDKHVKRLQKMKGTEFVNYDTPTGVWTFRVPHFTRYGLDYDEDEDDTGESPLSSDPGTPVEPTPQPESSHASTMEVDDEAPEDSSQEDDTFAFKQKLVPGGFAHQLAADYEQDESFSSDGSVAAVSDSEHSQVSDDGASDGNMEMAGSFPRTDVAAERDLESPTRPALKATQQPWGTPGKPLIDLDGDWAEQLQRTISPRKQNREALREVQGRALLDRAGETTKRQVSSNKKEFRTSIDVMNSLFGKHQERMAMSRMQEAAGSGFEVREDWPTVMPTHWPYPKRTKTSNSENAHMNQFDQAWHDALKPKWTPTGSLLYAQGGMTSTQTDGEWQENRLAVGEGKDVVESFLSGTGEDPYLDQGSSWRHARVSLVDGVPFVQHKNEPFSTFCKQNDDRNKKSGQKSVPGDELDVYHLAHILFDEYDDEISATLTAQQKKQYANRIRKDRLTKFWSVRVGRKHFKNITAAAKNSPEEAALWHLTVKNVAGACDALEAAKDYHLTILIAQIEHADDVFQEDMESQIEAWREQSIVSEMSEPIRALYELLAGNTTVSQGKIDGPLEDRASTFVISERFGFDWMQAFALCLWYGKEKHGSIEDAVRDFAEKLESEEESAYPYPDGSGSGEQESPLWVLLKLYASRPGTGSEPPPLPQALAPLSKPFDDRSVFELHHAIIAHIPYVHVDTTQADLLASDLAFQLSAAGFFIGASFALMHITDSTQRGATIKDLLARHAASLPETVQDSKDKGSPEWQTLTVELKIPTQWICEAKAQFSRSKNDSPDELKYLIAAELWSQAHHCLCRRVAPSAIIDQDWQGLGETLGKFGDKPEEHVADWASGGGIYQDFLHLIVNPIRGGKELVGLVRRLQASLADMGQKFKKRGSDLNAGGPEELEERVACKEMGRLVAEAIGTEGGIQSKTFLDLPLTADARLSQTRDLSVEYYRSAMASAK